MGYIRIVRFSLGLYWDNIKPLWGNSKVILELYREISELYRGFICDENGNY